MNSNAIKSGVILGVVSIVISLLIYLIDYTLMVNLWYLLLISPIITIAVTSYFGMSYRKDSGGYLAFGKSYLYAVICILTASLVATVWSILLLQVIDPELPQMLTDTAVENQESMMANFGAPQDAIDDAVEKSRTDMEENMTIGGQVKGFFTTSLLFTAILSLIAALFIKKKEPEFEG